MVSWEDQEECVACGFVQSTRVDHQEKVTECPKDTSNHFCFVLCSPISKTRVLYCILFGGDWTEYVNKERGKIVVDGGEIGWKGQPTL